MNQSVNKLIYIANVRMPTEKAHGIQIMKMCQAFALAKIELELLVPWRFNKIKKDPFDYYGVKKNFKIKKLPSLDLIPLSIPHLGFWIQSITFALAVFFYLLFKKADYIYSRDLFSLFPLSFFKKDIIYEAHHFPKHFWLYKDILKRIKGLVVITQKLKEFYQDKEITPEKILVVPDGVDLEEFKIKESPEECRRKLNLPLDKKIIGYVGQLRTMDMEKGIGCLVKALTILRKNNPLIILCLVGGQESDILEYKKMASKMNLTKNILFIRQVKHYLIPYYLKSFDVLVMPFPWTEHFAYYMSPLKMFEYMASRRPIVTSDLPSIREILNNSNAILVRPDNLQDLAKSIKRILKNPKLCAKISEQAYQDVKKYSWPKRAKKILEFINL